MTTVPKQETKAGDLLVGLENENLRVDVAPGVGGRVVSILDKKSGHEFLWKNDGLSLERLPAGSEYDPNFYGGIDELLPNDMPESLSGMSLPDHGELWTMDLSQNIESDALILSGDLPVYGLHYERRMQISQDDPHGILVNYRIVNSTSERRAFLWKLHAALNIEPGDRIESSARLATPVDLEWSRCSTTDEFVWPGADGLDHSRIPEKNGSVEFLYLHDLPDGNLRWISASKDLEFAYEWDVDVFPYAWLFMSFGGFLNHYTAILEPCTCMPISVSEADRLRQCTSLNPSESLETSVTLYAGPRRN